MIAPKPSQESIHSIKATQSNDGKFVHVNYSIGSDNFGYAVRLDVAREIMKLMQKVEARSNALSRAGVA